MMHKQKRCTCHVGFNWEYGQCDYCTSDECDDCEHESGCCPDDCFCVCNDNEEETEEE
jgi:hypothetical protein